MTCFVNGTPVSVFYDTFATNSFVATHAVTRLGLSVNEGVCSAEVTVIDDDDDGDRLSARITLNVIRYAQYDISLGRDWVAGSSRKLIMLFCLDLSNTLCYNRN